MATDTTNFTPDMNADTSSADTGPDFDAVQLAQASPAGTPVQVQIPEGQNLVRIPVAPGEVIILPFGADAVLAGKLGDNGNLAIKVGDVTVILEGYTAAFGQQPVVIETAGGKPIVIADLLSAGEGLDIQTAAGEAAGAQGADNTGAIFEAFGALQGAGGFGAIGAQDATALDYVLIETQQVEIFTDDTDTKPTPTYIPGEVDENGRHHLKENPFDDKRGGLETDNPDQAGDDERSWKQTVKIVDYGPDGPAAVDPLVGIVPADGKARDTDGNQIFSHDQEVLLRWNDSKDRLEGYVESDCCEQEQYPEDFARQSSESIEYNCETKCYERLVFTAKVEDGGVNGEVTFKLLGPLDHPFNTDPDAKEEKPPYESLTLADGSGDGYEGGDGDCEACDPAAIWHEFEDNIQLDLLFGAKDGDDAGYTPIPFVVDVDDDSPAFLGCEFEETGGFELINDETPGVDGQNDISLLEAFHDLILTGVDVEPGNDPLILAYLNFFGSTACDVDLHHITAAQKDIKFGYGADGPCVDECPEQDEQGENSTEPTFLGYGGDIGFGGDGKFICGVTLTDDCGNQMYGKDTGLTIDYEGGQLRVYMDNAPSSNGLYSNTVFGYAYKPVPDEGTAGIDGTSNTIQIGEGGEKIPVFVIYMDPDTKELTFVQLHQIHHDDPTDPDEAEPNCHTDFEQLHIGLAITDFDGDSTWAKIDITIEDDGPKVIGVNFFDITEIFNPDADYSDLHNQVGIIDEEKLSSLGNNGGPGDDNGGTHTDGDVLVDFGTDQPGKFALTGVSIRDDKGNPVALQTADGHNVVITVFNGVITGTDASDTPPNDVVFTMTINTDTGHFDFDLKQALKHPFTDPDFKNNGSEIAWEDNLHFAFAVKATDSDYDSVTTTVNIRVDDDSPANVAVSYKNEEDTESEQGEFGAVTGNFGQVDEDWLSDGNKDKDAAGNSDAGKDGDNAVPTNGADEVIGLVTAKFGVDLPGHFELAAVDETVPSGYKTSEGKDVYLDVTHGAGKDSIVGYVDTDGDKQYGVLDTKVFALELEQSGGEAGEFHFTLFQSLQHDDSGSNNDKESDLGLNFGVLAVDSDGDARAGTISIKINDDKPTEPTFSVTNGAELGGEVRIDEDFLTKASGNPSEGNQDSDTNPDNSENTASNGDGKDGTSANGIITVNFGADGAAAVDPLVLGNLTVTNDKSQNVALGSLKTVDDHGITITYGATEIVGKDSTDNVDVFRLTLDPATKAWTFTLYQALEHPFTNDPSTGADDATQTRWEDNLHFDFEVKATDKDGDTKIGHLKVSIDDDAPVAGSSETECLEPCDDREEQSHEQFTIAPGNIPAFVTLSAADQNTGNGNTSVVETTAQGFGVDTTDGGNPDSDGGPSEGPGDHGRYDEINYTGDGVSNPGEESEHFFADFGGKVASKAHVDLNVFFGEEGEVGNEKGAYRTYLDGVAGSWVTFEANNENGEFGIDINSAKGFDKIEFVALPGSVDAGGNEVGDSSDYSIEDVAVTLKACAQVEGDVSFAYGADGPGTAKLVVPQVQLTSGQAPVVMTVSGDGTVLTGKAGDTPVFELTLDPSTGKYHFYLYQQLDGDGEGDTHIPFQYKVTDADGDATLGTITVCVEQPDLIPINYDDSKAGDEGLNPDTNVLLVLDRSGSMNGDSGVPGKTKLDLAKDAAVNLLDSLALSGAVRVMLVTFNADATRQAQWLDLAAAKAAILAVPASANSAQTSYEDAITTAMDGFNDTGNRGDFATFKNLVYFLSDGVPTVDGEGDNSLTAGTKTAWNSLLEGNIDHVYSVGMGTGIPDGVNNTNLVEVANPDGDGPANPEATVLLVDNFADLSAALIGTTTDPIEGNILDGTIESDPDAPLPVTADFVGDGPAHLSEFSYNSADDDLDIAISWTGAGSPTIDGTFNGKNASTLGTEVSFDTDFGRMSIDFATGGFKFIPDPISDPTETELFTYRTTDSDGDVGNGAKLTLTINNVNHAPVANNDAADVAEDSFVLISIASLLANDDDVDGDPLSLKSVQGGVNGTAIIQGGDVKFTPTLGYEGAASFTYTIEDPAGLTSTATVNVSVISSNAAPNAANDILIIRPEGDTIIQSAWLLRNDTDADGDTLSISVVDPTGLDSPNGILANPGGSFTIDPDSTSQLDFTYRASDGTVSDQATVDIIDDDYNAVEGDSGDIDQIVVGDGANTTLNGQGGDDILAGGGGTDSLNGGDGDDWLVYDTADASIDGGNNFDTLRLESPLSIDIDNDTDSESYDIVNRVNNIEAIDLRNGSTNDNFGDGEGDDAISAADVLNMSAGTIYIMGDGTGAEDVSDEVRLSSTWTVGATAVVNDPAHADINGLTFTQYTNGGATLYVQNTIDVDNNSGG